MWQWAQENEYLIKHETKGASTDEHFSIEGNKLIADKLKEKGKSSLILSVYFHIQYLYL